MPFYEIQHSIPLSPTQLQSPASKITTLHSTTFSTPSILVNVKFTLVSRDEEHFVGGQKRTGLNRIFAHVGSGPARSQEVFAGLAEGVERAWEEVVVTEGIEEEKSGREGVNGKGGKESELHGVFIVSGIVAWEKGFAIPPAGEEGKWLKDSLNLFKERADAGDEDMRGLVEEMESRPELLGK